MASARPANSHTQRERHVRTQPARPKVAGRKPLSSIRWDRLGRSVLLLVFLLVAVIGVQGVLSFTAARAQEAGQQAIVSQLTRQRQQLLAEQRSLNNPKTIIQDARELGYVFYGEQPYVVTGLTNK